MAFWGKDPLVLLSNLALVPCPEMTKNEKLNALTRLSIVTSLILYAMGYKHWIVVLLVCLGLIIFVYVSQCGTTDGRSAGKREGFTLTPTFVDTDFTQTAVAPMYAEEWQVPPPVYEIMETIPPPNSPGGFEEPMKPQNYPYGQLLTTTNLLPYDEYVTRMLNGGVEQARNYANSAFLRNRLAEQDNMMRLYRKGLARRFRHNTALGDTYSPWCGY